MGKEVIKVLMAEEGKMQRTCRFRNTKSTVAPVHPYYMMGAMLARFKKCVIGPAGWMSTRYQKI